VCYPPREGLTLSWAEVAQAVEIQSQLGIAMAVDEQRDCPVERGFDPLSVLLRRGG
jgi:hypothetical protein